LWYLLRPLPVSEIWIAPGHLVSIDGYIDAEPITKVKADPVPTNLYMTYVSEAEVKTRFDRITTNLDGYEKRSTFSSYFSYKSSGDFTKHDLNVLGNKLIPFMKHDIIKAAMAYKNIEWEETISRPIVIYHPEKFKTGAPLHVGDEIIEINGELVESTDDINFILEPFHVGDELSVKVVRDGNPIEIPIVIKELDSRGRATLGVYLKHRFTFKDLNEDDVIQLDENYSGESGGFILTLGLIQQLEANTDLSKGRKIAGTGGITRGGDIKPIGNLDLKVLTAIKEQADVFFYPKFQEDQITEVKKKYPTGNLKLVGVRNIAEAIEYLLES
jgi:PDZ domain-containing protein